MKKVILAIIVAISTSCHAQKKEFSQEALQYELTTVTKETETFESILNKFKGKKIVVEIWAGWCSDCLKAMPSVKELKSNNPSAAFVNISMDKDFDKWQTAIEKYNVYGENYWVNDEKMMKGVFGKALDVDWIPRFIVINEKGEIVLYRAIEKDFDKINAALKK